MIMGDKYNVGALVQACQLYLLDDLQTSDLVQVAILGDLVKDEKLKNAAISKMGEHVGPLNELKDWNKLKSYPDLALEIAMKIRGAPLGKQTLAHSKNFLRAYLAGN